MKTIDKNKTQVSVVILNYNVKYHLDACIQSVQKALKNISGEIIVADNNSTDGSKDYFKDKFPDINFLWFNENYGFAKAYNKAIKKASGEYVFILNPDTLISENSIEKLLNFSKNKPNMGIIGGKMIDGTGKFLPESKRAVPTPWVAFGKLSGLYKILKFAPFHKYYAPHLQENETGKVEILTGAFMFLKKQLFEEINGFDERYFMYGEDIDLSYTVLKLDKKNYYFPEAKIIHFKGESALNDPKYAKNFVQTTFQFYEKHFQPRPITKKISLLLIWLWFKIRKKSKIAIQISSNKTYFFWGNSKNIPEAQKILNKSVKLFPNKTSLPPYPFILIFDTSVLNFSDIISFMEQNSEKKIKYRFYFPHSKIILGSDSKNTAGEIQKL